MAVASAGPYASLHLAPDRQPLQHPTTQFSTGRMPFLPPNQQRQSTEGTAHTQSTLTSCKQTCAIRLENVKQCFCAQPTPDFPLTSFIIYNTAIHTHSTLWLDYKQYHRKTRKQCRIAAVKS